MATKREVPATIEELFGDWQGEYQLPADLVGWLDIKPVGEEPW